MVVPMLILYLLFKDQNPFIYLILFMTFNFFGSLQEKIARYEIHGSIHSCHYEILYSVYSGHYNICITLKISGHLVAYHMSNHSICYFDLRLETPSMAFIYF